MRNSDGQILRELPALWVDTNDTSYDPSDQRAYQKRSDQGTLSTSSLVHSQYKTLVQRTRVTVTALIPSRALLRS